MNDRQKALMMLLPVLDQVTEIEKHFAEIVGRNQNNPPYGEADGSFTEEQWTLARDISTALTQIRVGYGLLKR